MRVLVFVLLVTPPVVERTNCGEPVYDEPATCVKICTNQLKKKVYAVKPLSWPVTKGEKEAVSPERVCACFTERVVVIDGVPVKPEVEVIK